MKVVKVNVIKSSQLGNWSAESGHLIRTEDEYEGNGEYFTYICIFDDGDKITVTIYVRNDKYPADYLNRVCSRAKILKEKKRYDEPVTFEVDKSEKVIRTEFRKESSEA